MVLECCLQCLNSGSNASGISQLVSVENSHNSINANAGAIRNRAICNSVELEVCTNGPSEDINGETGGNAVLNRLFVNVGDGTLRYCMENKIKLSQVSCIIITSLCPHNIAGFPGVFLSLSDLGVGSLLVIGPRGVKDLINLMTPFINRKFPVLDVQEIDNDSDSKTSRSDLHVNIFQIKNFKINVTPIAYEEDPLGTVGLAAEVIPINRTTQESAGISYGFVPVAGYFRTLPTIPDIICAWNIKSVALNDCDQPKLVVSFLPMTINTFNKLENLMRSEVEDNLLDAVLRSRDLSEIISFCRSFTNILPVLLTGSLNANLTEFQSSTKLLCLFNYLQRNIFVNPLENRLHFKLNNVGIDDKNYFSGATAYSKDVIIAEAGLSLRKKLLQHSEESLGGSSRLKLSLEDLGAFDVAVKSEISKLELLLSSRSKDNEHGTLNIYEDSNKGDLSARSAGSKRSITSISAENPVLSNYSVINELNSSMVSRDESVNTSNSNFLAASLLRLRIQGKRQSSGLSSDVSIVSDEGKRTEFSTNISIDVHAKDSTGSGISSPVTFETSCSFSPNNVDKGNFSDDEDDNSTTVERAEYVAKSVEHPKVVQSTPFIAKLAIQKPEIAIDGVSQEPVVQSSASTDEFTISFLGTGCATPSKYRNNACILVDIHIKNIHECGNFATTPTLGGSTDSAEVFLTLPKFKSRRVGSFDRDSDHNQSKTFINKHYSHTSTQHNIPQVLPPGDKSESPILLLDCGESTSIQMFRKANGSLEEFDKMLLRIKVVWISHHHADHVCGFPALIQQIHRARMRMKVKDCTNTSNCNNAFVIKRPFFVSDCSPNKILVVANESVLHYFEYVCNVAGIDSNLICYYPIKNSLYNGITKDISIVTNNYVTSLKSIPVLHCHQSYGVVITLRNGKVIVYSGDCRPSQTLAKAGYNCDLLIHEATFDNSSLHDETDCQFTSNGKDGVKSFQADAIKKKHCTVDEAVAIGRQMNAKFIFLTHFSQRSTISMVNTTRTIYGTQGSGLKCDNFHDRMIARGQAPCPVEYDFSKADSCAYDSRSSQLDSSFGSQSGLNEYYLNSYGGYAPRIEPPAICQLVNPSITTNISSYQRNDVNNSSKSNIFVAYDLMTVSYPSQMQKLAEGIQNLSESLAALKRLSSNSHY